jgi:PAS domain S-box-containing protein
MVRTKTHGFDDRNPLASSYASALEEYVAGGAGEAALALAYELGRRAAAQGIGVLEIGALHHEALSALTANRQPRAAAMIPAVAQFFNESLSPFEMTLRAYREHARLLGLGGSAGQRTAETDRAHEQLQTILDATTAVIYLKDSDGRYLFVNRQFQQVFRVRREEVIGKIDAAALPPAIAESLRSHDQPVLAAGVAEELEVTIPLDDGPHTYLALKFPLLDAAGSPYAICSVATDITERKRADEALQRAKEAAESANRELESFSYSVAHDLRAPLRSIDGFSQALEEDCADKLDQQGRKYLQYVRESAQHMAHLIDDLLALSRVTRSALQPVHVDLSDLARRTLERLQAGDAGRRVEYTIQDGVSGWGDPHLIAAVLENLLGNAWKFTGKRAVGRIEFGRQTATPPVYFVRDNGAGFDMAYAGKLFGVFQRLHSVDEFEGTGIGLATVQRIVHRHRGRVWAEGEPGGGATFYFTLEEDSARQ